MVHCEQEKRSLWDAGCCESCSHCCIPSRGAERKQKSYNRKELCLWTIAKWVNFHRPFQTPRTKRPIFGFSRWLPTKLKPTGGTMICPFQRRNSSATVNCLRPPFLPEIQEGCANWPMWSAHVPTLKTDRKFPVALATTKKNYDPLQIKTDLTIGPEEVFQKTTQYPDQQINELFDLQRLKRLP